MPRQNRPWKEQMNKGTGYYHEEEEKPQKKLNEFIEEDEECQQPEN